MTNLRLILSGLLAAAIASAQTVSIQVDAAKRTGPLRPVWSFFGHDEPNYTYMKDGRKLLTELASLSPVPVYMRVHNLLTSGDGEPGLKWGSTNAYTEDASGKPVYNWTITDRIFDTYLQRKMKPLVQIGFMPEALSTHPQPYRFKFVPGDPYNNIFTGWAYPPKDYAKWSELVYQWVTHCVQKYGKAEVESWLFEVWNEPDIGYWKGTPEEYHKLYDYSADAVRRALPTARVGGPDSTGPGSERAARFLRSFLEHVVRGKNYVTGDTGSPLDFVSFHAKGAPKFVEGNVVMGIDKQLNDLAKGFEMVASIPEVKNKPIIIGESDPEGCAACSSRVYPQNSYRNGLMYASYTGAVMPRHLDLAAQYGVNLLGAVTWAFEFEDQPWFDGFRDLATNGVDKPVLNVFRMLGMMTGDRAAVTNPAAASLEALRTEGARDKADVHAMASIDAHSAAVLISNYHASSKAGPAAPVDLAVSGLPRARMLLQHFRVDDLHSNSYEVWKGLGSPAQPTPDQRALLESAGQLAAAEPPRWLSSDGSVRLQFDLPLHGVSLLLLTW